MTAKLCIICNESIDGWVYDNLSFLSACGNNEISLLHIGYQCKSCGGRSVLQKARQRT